MANKRKNATTVPKEVEFDYIKSTQFRVVRVDGAWGGLAGPGVIHMDLYSERPTIPTKIVYELEGGQLGAEIQSRRQSRTAKWVREVEVGVSLDYPAAKVLHAWLGEKIGELEVAFAKAGIVPIQPATKKTNGG